MKIRTSKKLWLGFFFFLYRTNIPYKKNASHVEVMVT